MKKLLMVFAVSATTFLGSCTTIPGGPPLPPNVIAVVSQVQAYTKAACGFIPTAATIAAIFASASITSALHLAQAICAAVNPVVVMSASNKAASAPRPVNGWIVERGKVNGVVIRGSKA